MNHWLRSTSLRALGAVFLTCGLAVGSGSLAREPERVLKSGEAFVIVKVTGDVKALSFQRFQGEESFVASRNSRGVLLRVKPGRYYLKDVTPVHMGIRLPSNSEPSEPSQTVVVREGMVNYIGDWNIVEDPSESTIRYDYDLTFDLRTVKAIVKKHDLPKYALLVSKMGENPIQSALP
jgi:hypothetical protein